MHLLRELTRLQRERGCLSDETLQELSRTENVPLYHLEGLTTFYPHFRRTPPPVRGIHVCRDVCCAMRSPADALDRMRAVAQRVGDDFELTPVSCLGRCDDAPIYSVTTLEDGEPVTARPTYSRWKPIGSRIDPFADEERRYGMVCDLSHDRELLARHAIEQLNEAGLCGMGGAGFPTGRKWELVASAPLNPPPTDRRFIRDEFAFTPQKYVICNADESEPGTFKDREILSQLPHLVVEGMILAGLTIGAERGIVFLRHEYEPELHALEAELERARSLGVLGNNAAGSGRAFDIEIFVSPGGYILGEETALLECLEDKRGEPRNKPPYPGQQGLYGQPTLINNVETFALATAIIHHGADWWHAQGNDGFSGLKFVCISGDVEQPGVFEIPVGTTIAALIEMAGGMRDGKSLKAFLPGGASSNFLPASAADTPIDFEAIREAGGMLGTGAVIVFDETRDLFALATNLVEFFRNESCGKCVPCRIGTQRAVEVLDSPGCESRPSLDGAEGPLAEQLQSLNLTLEQTSICGLGQVALHPILSMLEQFPEEFPVDS